MWHQRELLARRLPEEVAVLDGSSAAMAARQQDRLRRLVAHAQSSSPWLRHRLRGVDPSTVTVADLQRVPVMTKLDPVEHWDGIVTDGDARHRHRSPRVPLDVPEDPSPPG